MLHTATVRNVKKAFKEVNSFEVEGEALDSAKRTVKKVLELGLEKEVAAYVCAQPYERVEKRRGYRCGSYTRRLLTRGGEILVKVPRIRHKGLLFRTLAAYARRAREIDLLILSCFVLGMSTHKVAKTLGTFLGSAFSAQTVSQVAKSLDGAVLAFHRRPLEQIYPYLLFDGVVLKHRGALAVRKRILLCVYGITAEGVRHFIDFSPASSESAAQWEGFLTDLYRRGLTGQAAQLILTDGGTGLHAALEVVYPRIARQRCWAHKVRNVLDKIKKADWKPVKRALGRISHAKHRTQAIKAFWAFAERYSQPYPKAVACVRADIDDLLTFLDYPPEHRNHLRTTNAIERAFREIRRSTRPIGVFKNSHSLDRIVYAVIHYLNSTWMDKSLPTFAHNS